MFYNIKINLEVIKIIIYFAFDLFNLILIILKMEKIINFGFKIGASEIIFKYDACQLVFSRSIDARDVYALVALLDNHYKDCSIKIDRVLENRDEVVITVNPLTPKL